MRLVYIDCKACKGTGEFLGYECKTCRGHGQVAVKVTEEEKEVQKKEII